MNLKKYLLALCTILCIVTSSFGLNLFDFVAGNISVPPTFIVHFKNSCTTTEVGGLDRLHSIPNIMMELPNGTLAVGAEKEFTLDEMSVRNFVNQLDSNNGGYSPYGYSGVNLYQLNCPVAPDAPFKALMNYDNVNPINPISQSLKMEVTFCFKNKCELAGNPYNEMIFGYVFVEFKDMN